MLLRHLSKKIFSLSFLALALNGLKIEQAHAIKIPFTVAQIQNQVASDCTMKHSAYNRINRIIENHHEFNLCTAFLILGYGVGAVALVPSLVAEGTNTTPWGHELHRAKKLKSLIIASSKSYASKGDPYVFSDKSLGERKRKHASSETVFAKFYSKLQQSYPHKDAPSKESIKRLLYQANKTGLLANKRLLAKMINSDSFSPLIQIIADGQLVDRIEKIEAVVKIRKQKVEEYSEYLISNQDIKNLLIAHSSNIESRLIFESMNPILQAAIDAIEEFNFPSSKNKNMGYELVD